MCQCLNVLVVWNLASFPLFVFVVVTLGPTRPCHLSQSSNFHESRAERWGLVVKGFIHPLWGLTANCWLFVFIGLWYFLNISIIIKCSTQSRIMTLANIILAGWFSTTKTRLIPVVVVIVGNVDDFICWNFTVNSQVNVMMMMLSGYYLPILLYFSVYSVQLRVRILVTNACQSISWNLMN